MLCCLFVCFFLLACLTWSWYTREHILFCVWWKIGIGAYANMNSKNIYIPFGIKIQNLKRFYIEHTEQHYYIRAVSTAGFNTRFFFSLKHSTYCFYAGLLSLHFCLRCFLFVGGKYSVFIELKCKSQESKVYNKNLHEIHLEAVEAAKCKKNKWINTPNQMKVKQNVKWYIANS